MHQESKDSKWNFAALIADGSFFSIGVSFLESNTIFPALISQLTGNSVLIGLMSTIRNAGYLLPQLFVAGYAERLPLKKPLLRINGIISRLSVLFMAAMALFVAGRNPGLALIGLISANAVFALSDGIGGVPWIDMTAKVIPSNRRGRLFGIMQFVGGIGAFLAGFLIRQILASDYIPFPRNYGILLSLGFLFLCFSFAGTMLVREVPGPVRSGSTFRAYLGRLPDAWRRNKLFQRMMFTRMLYAFLYLSLPFYAIFARQRLGFAESDLGFFVSAQMAGNITAGLLWGYLGDRFGNRAVVRGVGIAAMLTPAFALSATALQDLGYQSFTMLPILLLFFCIGGTLSGMWMGFTNYLLELVDDVDRPTYIGMMNTLTAPFTFLPVVGGLIIQNVSHEALFVSTLIFLLAGNALAHTLPEPRTLT
jgi:MFS family permease